MEEEHTLKRWFQQGKLGLAIAATTVITATHRDKACAHTIASIFLRLDHEERDDLFYRHMCSQYGVGDPVEPHETSIIDRSIDGRNISGKSRASGKLDRDAKESVSGRKDTVMMTVATTKVSNTNAWKPIPLALCHMAGKVLLTRRLVELITSTSIHAKQPGPFPPSRISSEIRNNRQTKGTTMNLAEKRRF